MSLSAESLNLRRKRIATDRALNNGDLLVVKKKARQADAVQSNATVTTAAPAPKKGGNVSLQFNFKEQTDHPPNRQLTFVVILLSR